MEYEIKKLKINKKPSFNLNEDIDTPEKVINVEFQVTDEAMDSKQKLKYKLNNIDEDLHNELLIVINKIENVMKYNSGDSRLIKLYSSENGIKAFNDGCPFMAWNNKSYEHTEYEILINSKFTHMESNLWRYTVFADSSMIYKRLEEN